MKNIYSLIFTLFIFGNFIKGQSTIQTQLGSAITCVVAKDGSGQYSTVQAAVNSIPNNSTTAKVIFVKKGTYTEKVEIPSTKTNLYIIGEEVNTTIIAYGDYSGSGKIYNGIITSANGVAIGTSTSHTMYVAANDFTLMNITIKNTAGDVGQAVALNSKGERHIIYHSKLIGYQDTYYTWTSGRVYAKDSYIEGAIDYIFGSGVALFDSCQIHSVRTNSYITAASTDQNFKFGYVFNNCKLTASSGVSSVYLGRPWKAYAQTVFMNSEIGSFLSSAGWYQWSSAPTNSNTCYYAEYKNCGVGSGTGSRVSWSKQLTATQAATYTKANLFDKAVNPSPYATSWNPDIESNSICKIIKNNTSRFITTACFSSTPVDCNGVANGSAKLDNCDRCVAGNTGKTACTTAAEAELEACAFEGVTETSNSGYKGTSYLNINNAIGSGITFSVNASVAGNATISFRYSNGGTADRPAQVILNGVTQANNLSFPTTGSFTSWKSVDLTLNLQKGNNTIKISSTTADGLANIDQIGYVSSSLTKGNCVVTDISESNSSFDNLKIYPNPVTDRFVVKQPGFFTYQLIDETGVIILNGNALDEVYVDQPLKASFYFLKILTENSYVLKKLIKRD